MFAPMRSRAFAGLWFSYTVSVMATALLPTVVTLMVLDGPGGISALGIVLAFRTFGFLLGAFAGGYFADGWPRPYVLCGASVLRGLATLAMALRFHDNVPAVAACLLLAGSGEGIFRSAYQASVADVVDAGLRQGANALTTLSMRISLTAGPLAAVSLYTALGARAGLSLAAGLWLVSGLAILSLSRGLPTHAPVPPSSRGFLGDYREGIKEALRHHWFVAGIGALIVWLGVGNSMQQLMLPVVSRAHLGGDAFIGFALGAYSLGALGGSILLGNITLARPGLWAFVGLAVYGLVPLALYSQSPEFILVAYFLGGLGIECFNIPWFTAIQNSIPREMLGRISSIDFLVSYGISPLTLAALPVFLLVVGQGPALLTAGAVVLVVPLLALRTRGAPDLKAR